MVGSMMLMKMLHCRTNFGETRNDCGEGTSQNEKISDMDIKSELFPHDTCRICLKEGKLAIFGANAEELCDSIYDISGIGVSFEDPYPKCLCQSCHALLQGAILFRRTARKSEKILKKSERILKKSKPEPNPIEDTAEASSDGDANDEVEEPNTANNESDKSKFSCYTCDLHFDTLEQFTEHRKGCQQLAWGCSLCDKKFDTYQEYVSHKLSSEHENRRVTCKVCKKTYAHKYFKRHKVIHEADAPFMCDICGKKFAIQSHFSRHRLTHFYDLPFKCSLCPYRGRFTESLKMHMRSHTGEKPYQCDQCPSRFINKSNLNKHTLTHKGEHNFRCEVCGKGYYTKRELDLHIKVDHTGVRDHDCRYCGKSFGYRKQMMKHELKVHKREKMKSGRMPIYLKVETMKQNEPPSV